jgi:hypothetical protein
LARVCSGDDPAAFGREIEMDWPAFSKPESGVLAVDYRGGAFLFLTADSSMHKTLVTSGWDFQPREFRTIEDSTAVGLCYVGDELYLAYEDRRIEKWTP